MKMLKECKMTQPTKRYGAKTENVFIHSVTFHFHFDNRCVIPNSSYRIQNYRIVTNSSCPIHIDVFIQKFSFPQINHSFIKS